MRIRKEGSIFWGVEYRLAMNWKEVIKAADRNESHLIHMGDFLTEGIVKQFPEKFK